jgi:hypothetical protein
MKKYLAIVLIVLMATGICAQKTDEPAGKISGVIFGDYYWNAMRDTGFSALKNTALSGLKDVHGLQLRRIYFTYDYKFSSKFSSRFRVESDEANFTANSSDNANKFGLFIKDAHIKWSVFSGHDLIIGIQPTPAFEVSEGIWGNRFLEKTIMDLRGIVPSRDMAISLKGRLDSSGIIKYWVMYGNNSPGKPEKDQYKRFFGQLEFTPLTNFSITLYADYQARQGIQNEYDSGNEVNNDILTLAFFSGYKMKDKYSAGFELYYNKINNGYTNNSSLLDKPGIGISIFGSVNITQKLTILGRYDYFEPNNQQDATGDKRNWFIAGMTVKPVERLIISPNIIIESYEKVDAIEIVSSVTPRLSFSWTF